jgi:CBS domain-containing protein
MLRNASNAVIASTNDTQLSLGTVAFPCPVLNADEPCGNALAELAASRAGSVVVLRGGRPAGLFPAREALRLCLDGTPPSRPLGELWTHAPLVLAHDLDHREAWRSMNDAGAREAVVVDGDGVVCGLFDATCMLHWAPDDALQGLGDIDLQPLSTVPQFLPQAPLGGVLDALLDRGLECAVAANRGAQPQGLLTPHALAQLIVRAAPIEQLSLGDCVLRLSPALCAPLSVADAVRHMRQLGLRQLPIVRNGKLAGLLDADQLADRLASDDQPEGERGPRSRESELEQLKTRQEDEVAQRTHQLEAPPRR